MGAGTVVITSVVPGAGEFLDVYTLLAPDSTTTDRVLSGVSLLASVLSAGVLPNYGAYVRSAKLARASRYLSPGPGAMVRGELFKHAWIKKDLFRNLQRLVGKADFNKFKAALNKGVVGPKGQSGVKILRETVDGYTHELKIGGSAQRLLGRIDENGVLVFEELARGGLH